MNATAFPERDSGLIFGWDQKAGRRLSIIGFLLGSVALHALCFYAFQIIYPPAVALLPPPARVSIIAPNSDEGRLLLRWLEAEDPALASTTMPLGDGKSLAIPTIQHAPSYLARQPPLRELPPLGAEVRIPSAHPPAPVELPRAEVQPRTELIPTMIRFSPELEALGAVHHPEIKFTASGRESPQSAQFRIAVSENGEVRYCFLETSSGDTALDEQARRHLALCRFPAIRNPPSSIGNALTWATATVEWGNDTSTPPTLTPETAAP